MRDINDILKLFAHEFNMDYCRHFDRVKSALVYANRHIKYFEKIQFRGGNETIINDIIAKLEENIEGLNSVDNDHDLRKITFFLILNTDATYKYDLKSDQHICHILDATPQIPKCLLTSIIWGLKLDKYLYECLRYAPSWFSFQFIEPATASMKYLEPYDVLDKVESLVKAIFGNMCCIESRKMDIVTVTILLNKCNDHTMELLRQFYTPDTQKFSDWSKREFFKYQGIAIRHILRMVLFAFDCLEFPLVQKIEECYKIYEISKESSPINDMRQSGYSEVVREVLMKILMVLMNTLQYNVMLVTIDVFMHWAEQDITDGLTLQAQIGDFSYQVLDRMAKNNKFGHDVENHLKFIAIEPKTLKETIREATVGDILRKVESNETDNNDKQLWLNELLSHSLTYDNDECLETISENAMLLSYDNCVQIIDNIRASQDDLDENASIEDINEWIPKILTNSLNNFKVEQLIELILYEIKMFGRGVTLFQIDEFEERCTRFFNKSTDNIDVKEFLKLSFENPDDVWEKYFNEACTSHQQAKNFCNLATTTVKLSKFFLSDLLHLSCGDRYGDKFYPHLLFEIYETRIIDNETFFKNFIYTIAKSMLDSEEYSALLAIMKALSMISHKAKNGPVFGAMTAPVLVMIAEIMDECRWDLLTYSNEKDELVRLSIDCVQVANKSFLPNATGKVKEWISTKVKEFKPLTRYYFQKYSLDVSEQPKAFHEFLQKEQNFSLDETTYEKFLITNIVRCTMKETEWLAKSDILQMHISDVMLLLESLLPDIGENGICNFRNCISNYANVVKKIMLPELKNTQNTRQEAFELTMKIMKIVHKSPTNLYDEIFLNLHVILLDVLQLAIPLSDDNSAELKGFVGAMESCRGKMIFEQKIDELQKVE